MKRKIKHGIAAACLSLCLCLGGCSLNEAQEFVNAGLGISEVTDSMTIIVSEETGKVTIAFGGRLLRNLDSENLRNKLVMLQNKTIDAKRFRLWKGRRKNEKINHS